MKILTALVAVAALSGGIAIAAAPAARKGPEAPPRAPSINAAGNVTQAGYVALTPCRAAYTRKAGGALAGGHRRGFFIGGTSGFPGQGGTAGGCKVPIGASSVTLAVTTSGPTGGGYLTAYATGTAQPDVRSVSYNKAQTTTNTVIAPVNPTNGQVTVFASTTTHIVLDIVGYYREPIAAEVNSDGSVIAKSGQVTSVTHASAGQYVVKFENNVGKCAVLAVSQESYYNVGAVNFGSEVHVYTRDVTVSPTVYADALFTLTVTC